MSRVRRLIRGTGTAVIAGLVLSACSNTAFDTNAATKVLQSVDVNLDSTGAITDVAGQAVYLDEITGESDSSEESFAVEDVVDDLPVRISTRYETDEGTGTNLDDLDGHTGRVNIEVTVENLTLDSSELTYDVAGESRQTPALVGTPLSVAGSTELEDTQASDIILDAESGTTTNGVVSQTSEGDAVVQWGTVLAPPQSEATTTFQLVADVEDFSTPEIDIAVQAGFHTDMSFEGLLTSTFDTSTDSDYAMQQQAIELVAEVNDVLTRAGTTITDIRTTLDHTTETLGVDAAAQLKQNSDDMVSEMERVGEQMTALESQVDGSMTGAETAMNSQLSQIVASMNSMMGNTDATAPQLMQGEGCAATVQDSEMNGSLYSTFLVLGAQLDGYAEANAECRDEIIAEIANTLGPEVPDAETCDPENGVGTSITCSLLDAQNSVLNSLGDLISKGDEIIESLNTEPVDKAVGKSEDLKTQLSDLDRELDDLEKGLQVEDKNENITALEDKLTETEQIRESLVSVSGEIEDSRNFVLEIAKESMKDLDVSKRGSKISKIQRQQEELAQGLCDLKTELPEPPEVDESDDSVPMTELVPAEVLEKNQQIEDLRSELVETDCEGNPKVDSESPKNGALVTQIETLADEHFDNWKQVVTELETPEPKDPSAIDTLDTELQSLKKKIEELEDGLEDVETGHEGSFTELKEIVEEIRGIHGKTDSERVALGEALEQLKEHQDVDLPAEIRTAFEEVTAQTTEELPADIDEQVRIVTDRINTAQDSVIESYNSTIAGLATTSDAVINDTADQIDEQQSTLEEQQEATTDALSESTTAVIEAIHDSTAASTRDLEGASAQLGASLNNVILDLGDPDIQGSGILGSMSASSAMSDTADYQLALASQRASGYANVRSEDIAEIMLRQAQFSASLEAAASLPAFHLDVPSGARSQTIYSFRIGGDGS